MTAASHVSRLRASSRILAGSGAVPKGNVHPSRLAFGGSPGSRFTVDHGRHRVRVQREASSDVVTVEAAGKSPAEAVERTAAVVEIRLKATQLILARRSLLYLRAPGYRKSGRRGYHGAGHPEFRAEHNSSASVTRSSARPTNALLHLP